MLEPPAKVTSDAVILVKNFGREGLAWLSTNFLRLDKLVLRDKFHIAGRYGAFQGNVQRPATCVRCVYQGDCCCDPIK